MLVLKTFMMMSMTWDTAAALCIASLLVTPIIAFCPPRQASYERSTLGASKLSDLPTGVSPFEKSWTKSVDVDAQLRKRALSAFQAAKKDGIRLMEIDFPPLLGQGKTQFDDFDNIQEINQNRDWCIEFMPSLTGETIWFLLPDVKEVEMAKEEWTGQRYRQAATFTTIEKVTAEYASDYTKPWGASIAAAVQSATGTENLLGNVGALDTISRDAPPTLHLICQPGNGGPVEDWINCEILHNACPSDSTISLIVNGALDKVRDGYYPGVFFPKLAATVDRFYRNVESILYLKPISDKGVYGWLYRVYPEPWQVVLQTVKTGKNDKQLVENTVVSVSDARPTYAQAVQKLLQGAADNASSQVSK
jgi:hypothetical protein